MQTQRPQRVNILGVGVHATNLKQVVEIILNAVSGQERGYVCVTGAHGIMESQKDDGLRSIHNESMLTVPDGMPTVWMGRIQSHKTMQRVYGPDLMSHICRASANTNVSHFIYGGNISVAENLRAVLNQRFPGLKIVGTCTPPFRALNESEVHALVAQVESCRPDIFWVGLSTPKQERFMYEYISKLNVKVMIGVGAAFDVHTGNIKDAPDWMKSIGLQWFHRLVNEPRRLWKRYAIIVPGFLVKAVLQLVGLRKYRLE